jgi:hypothetical protein
MDFESNEKSALAQWVYERTNPWETWRDNNYKDRWDGYYRSYRGFWIESDKLTESERSRLVPPELSQAIETLVAEIEEATFIRERWVDIVDDVADEDPSDIAAVSKLLLEDMDEADVANAISEAILNGAIYGTGILKIALVKEKIPTIDASGALPGVVFNDVWKVKAIPVSPRNFVIEPSATGIKDSEGCAHITRVPLNVVQARVADGTYYKDTLIAEYPKPVEDTHSLGELDINATNRGNGCKITEWHGLVPKSMVSEYKNRKETEFVDILTDKLDTTIKATSKYNTEEMVEAIVTIVNDYSVAKCVENPFLMGDRSFVAFQFDTVPNRFWGRGVGEKGYNSQKALEAEIRARIDALKLSTHPMMGIDATRVPRGEKFAIRAGRNILTRGNPGEVLMPLKFPPPDPHTFQQSQELREMLQRGTGAYDLPSQMANANRMAATSMSMVVGSMIKRSKRTLANVERQMLRPLVQKILWRSMQFKPEQYPLKDYKFKVRGSMGIMAREFEQGQLVSLLSTVPGESPAFWMLMKGIYENSSIDNREEMIQYADQMLEQSMQPPEPDPEVMQKQAELEFRTQEHQDKMNVEARKLEQRDIEIKAEAVRDEGEGRMQTSTAVLQLVKAETNKMREQSETLLNIAKAQEAEDKVKLEAYKLAIEELKVAVEKATVETSKVREEAKAPSQPQQVLNFPNMKSQEVLEEEESRFSALKEEIKASITAAIPEQGSQSLGDDDIAKLIKLVEKNSSGENSQMMERLDQLQEMINQQGVAGNAAQAEPQQPLDLSNAIERDPDGRVRSIAGKPVLRDESGRLKGVE